MVSVFFVQKQKVSNLVTPTINEVPNSTPNAPRTYNFDSSSDLKKELDSINPQVLDSDFE